MRPAGDGLIIPSLRLTGLGAAGHFARRIVKVILLQITPAQPVGLPANGALDTLPVLIRYRGRVVGLMGIA
jgi:hypothetical protein